MRRRAILVPLVLGLALLSSPASARYGSGNVNTWLKDNGGTVGRTSDGGTMTVRLLYPYSHERVRWVIAARGGQSGTYHLMLQGCATGGGVGFRYFLQGGKEVTRQVVHDGFTADVHHVGDKRSLSVRVAWRAKRVERTCGLVATGNTGSDHVTLRVITN